MVTYLQIADLIEKIVIPNLRTLIFRCYFLRVCCFYIALHISNVHACDYHEIESMVLDPLS